MSQTWTMDGDLIGYGVAATDGDVGTIDHATTGAAGAYVVVDLASGVPGGKRVIPAGAITALDGVGPSVASSGGTTAGHANLTDAHQQVPPERVTPSLVRVA